MKRLYTSTQFDERIGEISQLKWLPWIGEEFLDSTDRLMIVGESHYDWQSQAENSFGIASRPDFTRHCINNTGLYKRSEYAGNKNNPLIRNLERAIIGKSQPELTAQEKLWDSVSYEVIVQRLLSSLQERPTATDYQAGWKILFELFAILKPTHALMCGVESLSSLASAASEEGIKIIKTAKADKIGRYLPRLVTVQFPSGFEVELIFIRHPSKFFSWSKWHGFLEKNWPEVIAKYK